MFKKIYKKKFPGPGVAGEDARPLASPQMTPGVLASPPVTPGPSCKFFTAENLHLGPGVTGGDARSPGVPPVTPGTHFRHFRIWSIIFGKNDLKKYKNGKSAAVHGLGSAGPWIGTSGLMHFGLGIFTMGIS